MQLVCSLTISRILVWPIVYTLRCLYFVFSWRKHAKLNHGTVILELLKLKLNGVAMWWCNVSSYHIFAH